MSPEAKLWACTPPAWSSQMAEKSTDKVKRVYRRWECVDGGWCWDDSTLLGKNKCHTAQDQPETHCGGVLLKCLAQMSRGCSMNECNWTCPSVAFWWGLSHCTYTETATTTFWRISELGSSRSDQTRVCLFILNGLRLQQHWPQGGKKIKWSCGGNWKRIQLFEKCRERCNA